MQRWCEIYGLAAVRAARSNRLQTSLNLALGSALASIGLTIPTVAIVSIALQQPLELGLGAKDQLLLALTLLVGVITLGTGRTTVLDLESASFILWMCEWTFPSAANAIASVRSCRPPTIEHGW